ncbi:MAG: Hpt domain-containing protein [Pseudomonadota bacterium]
MAKASQDTLADVDAEMMTDVLDGIEDKLMALDGLLAGMSGAQSWENLAEYRRLVHSLKGLARAFGLSGLAALCHACEDGLAAAEPAARITLAKRYLERMKELFLDIDSRP